MLTIPSIGVNPLLKKRGDPCRGQNRTINRAFYAGHVSRLGRSYASEMLPTLRCSAQSWRNSWRKNPLCPVRKQPIVWEFTSNSCASGGVGGARKALVYKTSHDRGVPRFFPPRIHVIVKGLACELPAKLKEPLSRLFIPDIQRIIIGEKHVKAISKSTIWRILDADALKPWRRRSWIWSRDPLFFERAAPVLDLYQGIWKGRDLRSDEYVLSADEKTSIQARIRLHPTIVTADGRGQRIEHEYKRGGAWTYLAALDVHRAKVFGRTEQANGIAPFHRLVAQVMEREPYASARRVFWIVDQGSSHRPTTFPQRLKRQFRNAEAVILPVHASWLNQIEIYFSILERKALTPNDFTGLHAVAQRIRGFEQLFMRTADPFDWKFTRGDLRKLLKRMSSIVIAPGVVLKGVNHHQLKQTG